MFHACSPHLPARASPAAVPCAPRSLGPTCGLTSPSPHRWRSTRSTSPSSPWPPAASRRRWRGHSSSVQVRSAGRASAPCPPPRPGAPCAHAAGYGLPVQWCTYCGTYCGACRCGGLGGGQGGLQPADLLAVPLRHHRRWAVLGASLPGKPRPVSARLPTPPPLRVPPLPLPHGPAAAACGVRRGAQTQAAPTGGLAIPTMHTLPTERAHSLYS